MGKQRALLGGERRAGEEKCAFELSLVLPVRRAEKTLAETLQRIATWLNGYGRSAELIVVDDGSDDATDAAAARWRSYFDGFQLVRHEVRRGVGAAARSGALAARGSYVFVVDPDLPTPIENAALLVESLANGSDVAVVSRMLDSGRADERPFLERAAETTFMAVSKLVVEVGVRDGLAGLRGFRRRAVRKIAERSRVHGPAYAFEWLALAQWFGFHVIECPVRWVRPGARSSGLRAGGAPGMLRDLVRTRRLLAQEVYRGALSTRELLEETSFMKLDRPVELDRPRS